MPTELLAILKQVSRSFYLTLRFLPRSMRSMISLAYLIARAADTIADSSDLGVAARRSHLQRFKQSFSDSALKIDMTLLLSGVQHPGERALLRNIDVVYSLFYELCQDDRILIENVCGTLVDGMLFDLEYFSDDRFVLKSDAELDRYTYLVAGCVGEFWTIVSLQSGVKFKNTKNSELMKKGVALGKALQHTNIIRDIAADFKINRVYVPEDMLLRFSLNFADFLSRKKPRANEALQNAWLRTILDLYAEGYDYLIAIPWYRWRLRVSVALPLVIGLRTLGRVQSDPFPNTGIPSKITRAEVYRILFSVSVLAIVTPLLRKYLVNSFDCIRGKAGFDA